MPRELGTIEKFEDIYRILRERAAEIGISREVTDAISGLTPGLASKIMAPRPIKRLGNMSLSVLLPTLGMRLVMLEDEAALARTLRHSDFGKRSEKHASHSGVVSFSLSKRFLRTIGRKGGRNSRKFLPPERRTELARKAGIAGAAARWRDVKAAAKG